MINNLECPVNPGLASDCRKIMAEWSNRTIDDQFDIDICEVACKHKDCIDDFRWRPEPTVAVEYARFRSMGPKDRDVFIEKNPNFFVKGKVYDYLEQRDKVIMLNKRNLFTLFGWLKLSGISETARAAIEDVLNTYSGKKTEESYNHKIMGLFYKADPETPKEVQDIADQVGGTVI